MNSEKRLENLRKKLKVESADGIAVILSSNVDYITGFDGIHDDENPHVALITANEAIFYTDSRYRDVSQAQVAGTPWSVRCSGAPVLDAVADTLSELKLNAVAVEDAVPYKIYRECEEKFAPSAVVAAKGWVEKIRHEKDENEIERIAAAQAIADKAFAHICTFIEPGVTEKEIAIELEYAMAKFGADAPGFPTIVASGANGALPHCVPGSRKVQDGDFITMDFGAQVGGYKSDMTRTVAIGHVTDLQRKVYETVFSANAASNAAVRAGATGVHIDKAGRDVIEEAGFGEHFGHGTGHGVGIDIHEGPNASPRSKDVMQAGDILTIEPGIYLPGQLGVRIEDIVIVLETGEKVLSTSSKELIIL